MGDRENFSLEGEGVVATGAGKGVGRAIVEIFAASGTAVMVSDRDEESAEAAAKQTEDNGAAAYMACDVINEDDLARFSDERSQRFGRPILFVSNAGGDGIQELN